MASDQLIFPKTESWKIFNLISKRYDFLNRLLSLGMDTGWRKAMIAQIPSSVTVQLLDLATGTADVIIAAVEARPNIYTAVGLDMAEEMLRIGREKIQKKDLDKKIILQNGDAQQLPFGDYTFDVLTISFGIRNIPDLRQVLMEMYRVTKPGGKAIILEFSIPKNFFWRMGYVLYLRCIVPLVGFLFSGNYRAYKYLNQTIEQFPYGDRFCKILKQMGFTDVH
ncbi:MAG: bifunctional demethylmenaquinone methyltransferase/2-methoxy-6-polyprenyl-1,4-benzoquinol methylase UbiE, partial [Candidatus Omnitrophica bacterium]|nr:bifunctional demethylmenaquinone methyltransferase/2-methoxy-6-polyprenyl-1,4-benzoquinol methylase UbiE [Candidatus Omnitrophota bacterium]